MTALALLFLINHNFFLKTPNFLLKLVKNLLGNLGIRTIIVNFNFTFNVIA